MTQQDTYAQNSSGAVDTARAQAAELAQTATESGSEVAQTATEQAKDVAAETGRQARDLVAEARGQLAEQTSTQQQKVAGGLRSLVDELTRMADKGGQSGLATELAYQAAERVGQVADWLEQREPGDLLAEVRRTGRQRPGAFLLSAGLAGVLVGRVTRGVAAASSGGTSGGAPDAQPGAASPAPSSAGTAATPPITSTPQMTSSPPMTPTQPTTPMPTTAMPPTISVPPGAPQPPPTTAMPPTTATPAGGIGEDHEDRERRIREMVERTGDAPPFDGPGAPPEAGPEGSVYR